MEFYVKFLHNVLLIHLGFNSQRDGILLYIWTIQKSLMVSIPNGMEFYQQLDRLYKEYERVSIPNGMEFYSVRHSNKIYKIMFQFPTGWNSTE